eukprot:679217-Prorocentrum_minimum.AAC.5
MEGVCGDRPRDKHREGHGGTYTHAAIPSHHYSCYGTHRAVSNKFAPFPSSISSRNTVPHVAPNLARKRVKISLVYLVLTLCLLKSAKLAHCRPSGHQPEFEGLAVSVLGLAHGRLLVEGTREQADGQRKQPCGRGVLVPDEQVDDNGGDFAHDPHNGEGGCGNDTPEPEGGVRHAHPATARQNQRVHRRASPCEIHEQFVLPEPEPKKCNRDDAEKVGVVHTAPAAHRDRVANVLDPNLVESKNHEPNADPGVRAHGEVRVRHDVANGSRQDGEQREPRTYGGHLATEEEVVQHRDEDRGGGPKHYERLHVRILEGLHVGEDGAQERQRD